ncbi:hypothetical protein QFC20_006787 [Naganishia adeliensis]|uniref:Uncharacterized protein n=1 Tax=Naganishia adeliensis TaxID=92952 RepID=A0ACC2V7P6_9TREE|nr:hypothetical protein QFC20_006787 [Naganishia adeliensis]
MPPKRSTRDQRALQSRPSRINPHLGFLPDAARGFANGPWNTDSSDSDMSVVPETYVPPAVADSDRSRILAPESLMDDPVFGRGVIEPLPGLAPPQGPYERTSTSARESTRVPPQDENTNPRGRSPVLAIDNDGGYGQVTRSDGGPTREALLDARVRLNVGGRTHPYRRHSRLRTVSNPTVVSESAASFSTARTVSNPVVGSRSAAVAPGSMAVPIPAGISASDTSSSSRAGNDTTSDPAEAATAGIVVTMADGVVGEDIPDTVVAVGSTVRLAAGVVYPTIAIPAHTIPSTDHVPVNATITIPPIQPPVEAAVNNPAPTVPSPASSSTTTVNETSPHAGNTGKGYASVTRDTPASQSLCTSSVRGHEAFQQALAELTYWEGLVWLHNKVRKGETRELKVAGEQGENAYVEAVQMVKSWKQNLILLIDALTGKLDADADDTPSKVNGNKRDMRIALGEDHDADTHSKRPRQV